MSASTTDTMHSFYRGKNIFITGATGFVGKVLLEKILYAFPDIGHIYILIRPKRNIDTNVRLSKLINDPVFRSGRVPKSAFNKIVLIPGVLGEKGLEISLDDHNVLVNNVNIVFHCAATIRFDEPLDVAMSINYLGTKSIFNLCKTSKNLAAAVFVSTAYANCHLSRVEEIVYPTKVSGDHLLECRKWLGGKELEKLAFEEVFEGRPNTYTFTKSLAENYLRDNSLNLPIAIARPSIINGALAEPEPGFCDNATAGSYAFIAQGLGVCRYIPIKDDAIPDGVSVDIVANSLLVIGRDIALKSKFKVYNVTANGESMPTLSEHATLKSKAIQKAPLYQAKRAAPFITTHGSTLSKYISIYISELLFAIAIDIFMWLQGKPTKAYKMMRAFQIGRETQTNFYQNTWQFPRANMEDAFQSLTEEDKKLFNCSPIVENHFEHVYNHWLSLRELKLGEKPNTIEKARVKQKRLRRIESFLTAMVGLLSILTFYYFVV